MKRQISSLHFYKSYKYTAKSRAPGYSSYSLCLMCLWCFYFVDSITLDFIVNSKYLFLDETSVLKSPLLIFNVAVIVKLWDLCVLFDKVSNVYLVHWKKERKEPCVWQHLAQVALNKLKFLITVYNVVTMINKCLLYVMETITLSGLVNFFFGFTYLLCGSWQVWPVSTHLEVSHQCQS